MRRALVREAAAVAAVAGRWPGGLLLLRGRQGGAAAPSPSSATASNAALAAASAAAARQRFPQPTQQQQRRLVSGSSAAGKKDGGGGQVMNEAIRTDRVRLVIKDEATGKSTSEMVTRDAALAKAREMGLDLVLVSKASEPWVCKLMNARKEEYLRQKKERQRSKGSKAQAIKELAIRGNISDHDLLIKLRRVTDFFAQGHSVRLTLQPTGSQMARRPQRLLELRDFILNDFLAGKTKSVVELQPSPPTNPRREIILHPKRQPPPPPSSASQQQQSSSSNNTSGKAKKEDGGGEAAPGAGAPASAAIGGEGAVNAAASSSSS